MQTVEGVVRGRRPVHAAKARSEGSLSFHEHVVLWCILLLLAVMPLHFFILHATGDVPVARLWKEILFALVLVGFLGAEARQGTLEWRAIASSRTVIVFAIAILTRATIGLFSGADFYLLVFGLYNWLFFIPLAGMAWRLLRTSALIDTWMYRLMVVIAVVGGAALVDWQLELSRNLETLSERSLQVTSYVGTGYRAYLGTDGPMELGIYLATGLLIAAYFIMRRTGGGAPQKVSLPQQSDQPARLGARLTGAGARLGAGVCWLFCGAGLWVTFSRGPMVAAAVGHGVLFFFLRRGIGVRSIVQAPIRAFALLWVVIPVGIMALLYLSGGAKDFLGSTTDWSRDEANVIRLVRWGLATERFLESPLIGDGIGEASTRLQRYREEELGGPYFQAESSLLAAAVDGGLLLVVPLLGLVVRLFAGLTRTGGGANMMLRQQAVLLISIFAAFTLEATINPMLDFRSFVLLAWLLFGVAMRLAAPTAPRGPGVAGGRQASQ